MHELAQCVSLLPRRFDDEETAKEEKALASRLDSLQESHKKMGKLLDAVNKKASLYDEYQKWLLEKEEQKMEEEEQQEQQQEEENGTEEEEPCGKESSAHHEELDSLRRRIEALEREAFCWVSPAGETEQ